MSLPDNKKWEKHFWFVIESVVQQTTQVNNQNSLQLMTLLVDYLPCLECRNHFGQFVRRETIINQEWLLKLKYEINQNKTRNNKRCCR